MLDGEKPGTGRTVHAVEFGLMIGPPDLRRRALFINAALASSPY